MQYCNTTVSKNFGVRRNKSVSVVKKKQKNHVLFTCSMYEEQQKEWIER
jgi:hypothetical protein